MFHNNSKILKFSFSQDCFFDINDSYSFENYLGDWILTYSGMKELPNKVKIVDYENFNSEIFSIIQSWKRKYPPKSVICDGLIWQFDVKISDRKNILHYCGHQEFPPNFYALEKLLDGYFLLKKTH